MPRAGLQQAITPETVVCRCEAITRAKLDLAIADGAVTINDLKSATRCGMGPCGGRSCEDAAAVLIAARTGHSRERIGMGTARPPLRPVPLDALLGDFDYEQLPIPAPAPL
jgi:NAD(P)H-nitrite reductase large subunit